MFEIIRISAFKDNYIWLLRKGALAIVVDPGDAAPVLKTLRQQNLQLSAILITHHHQDHQGGIADLLLHSLQALVFGPAAEFITALNQPLRGGEVIKLPDFGLDIQVLAIPGHTLGHLAYYLNGCLFCGDTLFGGGCGRIFEGTMAQMFDSLSRLAALPDDTQVYCAHEYTEANLRFALAVEPGNSAVQARLKSVIAQRAQGLATVPFSLALEQATNPFLRCLGLGSGEHAARFELSAAAKAQLAATPSTPSAYAQDALTVFSALRNWKNHF